MSLDHQNQLIVGINYFIQKIKRMVLILFLIIKKKIITGITERFYIDFSLNKDFYSFQNKKYQSAQETCHKSLEYLVDRIWCGDESNRQSIHMLRKLYTEGAEEHLFYYFHLLNNHSPRDTHIFNHYGFRYIPSWPCIHYTPYIEKIVKDFNLLNNQIKGNCNPYVQHAHLYFEQCFYFICSLVDLPNRIKDVKIPICSSLPKLIEETIVSIGRYPQFESFYIRLAEFFKFNNSRVQAFNCMNKLYEDDKFPYYYQNLGWAMYFIDFDENAHKKRCKEIIQRDPKMYRAKFDYAYCIAKERLYYEAESLFLEEPIPYENCDSLTSEELLYYMMSMLAMAKIYMLSSREDNIKAFIFNMVNAYDIYADSKNLKGLPISRDFWANQNNNYMRTFFLFIK